MNYAQKAEQLIDSSKLTDDPLDRISAVTADMMKQDYCIDVHTHLFDIRCINKSYFLIRMLKDMMGLKSTQDVYTPYSPEEAYEEVSVFDEDWDKELMGELERRTDPVAAHGTKGIIDVYNARKFLGFKKMEQVYTYYMDHFSLATLLGKGKNVLITGLMMDLETGWGTRLKKKLYEQISELKALSRHAAVLPFLACDPRRVEREGAEESLYSLFNEAFCTDSPFFGIKIYPALGYDPSDHRLWPVYALCEQYRIPVLTHCGGETVSTDKRTINVFEGDKEVTIKGKNRKEVAYILNDPARWEPVMKRFPRLKLNLAHFGGTQTWESTGEVVYKDQKRKECIFKMMRQYEHVYADFSYQLTDIKISKNLREIISTEKDILDKTLFGTDYWVVNTEGNLYKEQEIFLNEMDANAKGLPLSRLLTIDNPKRYLFG